MAVEELSPRDFCDRRAAGEQPQLLDVREAWERDIATLPQDLWIPMAQVPARLGELDPQRPVVVYCRSGARSLQVANFLSEHGYERVANLSGGILRWSRDIDPTIPSY